MKSKCSKLVTRVFEVFYTSVLHIECKKKVKKETSMTEFLYWSVLATASCYSMKYNEVQRSDLFDEFMT